MTASDDDVVTDIPEQRGPRYAAIDCGTNSIRLLIVEKLPDHAEPVEVTRQLRLVRLGEGVDLNREFTSAALERTFAAIDEYANIIDEHEVTATRFVATSATRDVSNRDEFEQGVFERLGVGIDVIDGREEAELSFTGAVTNVRSQHVAPFLVIDIGGGSTEFVLGDSEVEYARSVDIGCVRMTERHLQSDPPLGRECSAATKDIDAAIIDALADVPAQRANTVVGVAGTVTTVAAIALELKVYDSADIDGATISHAQVDAVSQRLLEMTRQERLALPGVEPGRVDVIGGGALILKRIMDLLGVDQLVVSEHDILDAIAWRLAADHTG